MANRLRPRNTPKALVQLCHADLAHSRLPCAIDPCGSTEVRLASRGGFFEPEVVASLEGTGSPVIPAASRKQIGAYYTPDPIVASLVQWAVHHDADRMLDPACGNGRFICAHRNSVGIEKDPRAAATAMAVAPWAQVHEADFFAWAAQSGERFDCAAGNPPFIRYQIFKGAVRERALTLCARLGIRFSGLASSWALFLAATASLLNRGGRLAFVVPAEIGHAPYASPLLEYMIAHFAVVHIVAVREKLFPGLSEDCWLLYAEGHGASTSEIRFTALETFVPQQRPPRAYQRISVHEWRMSWKRRLRPFLLPEEIRNLYRRVADDTESRRLGDFASVGIGYVSGANNFFHLRPSQAERFQIPQQLLHETVRNARVLPERNLTPSVVSKWVREDAPVYLLKLPKSTEIPSSVRSYLDTSEGRAAREAYKCRVRTPWYSVPDVQVPDFFLTYMSGRAVSLVRNSARCTCTNALHSVRLHYKSTISTLDDLWDTPFVQLSCEIEGHPLGGGMLKLEPREAAQIVLPTPALLEHLPGAALEDATNTMQTWRHYASAA
jgi:adenine-specific DNA-methyltransferase